MSFAASVALLAIGWILVSGAPSLPNLLWGAVMGSLALLLLRGRLRSAGVGKRTLRILHLVWVFLRELVIGAVEVAFVVLRPNLRDSLRPAIIAFPLRLTSDREIALFANLVTLTPGTLSVDVSPDRRWLTVHMLNVRDEAAAIAHMAGMLESGVMAVFA